MVDQLSDDRVSFCWSRGALLATAALMAGIGALGLLMLLQPESMVRAAGLAWFCAFALFAGLLLARLADTKPVVTISAAGIHDRRISEAPIPWHALADVQGFEVENSSFVGLNFHDPRTALAGAKTVQRLFAPLHPLFGLPAVSISMMLLDGGDDDLLAAMAKHRSDSIKPAT